MTLKLTEEQRQAVSANPEAPVQLVDEQTNVTYVMMRSEVYERSRSGNESAVDANLLPEVPPGIRASKEAFLRDLPMLMAKRRYRDKWTVYHGNKRLGIARKKVDLIRDCLRRGLNRDEYWVGKIVPHPTEPEEIEHSFFECEHANGEANP